MSLKKIAYLAEKVELYLKTATSFPTPETVLPLVQQVVAANSSNPALQGFVEVAQPISVDVDTMDAKCSVYFQLVLEGDTYNRVMNEQDLKASLVQLFQPALEQALQQKFRAYQFKVKVGLVPEIG